MKGNLVYSPYFTGLEQGATDLSNPSPQNLLFPCRPMGRNPGGQRQQDPHEFSRGHNVEYPLIVLIKTSIQHSRKRLKSEGASENSHQV